MDFEILLELSYNIFLLNKQSHEIEKKFEWVKRDLQSLQCEELFFCFSLLLWSFVFIFIDSFIYERVDGFLNPFYNFVLMMV